MRFLNIIRHTVIVALLTILTQIGGIIWLVALMFRRRVIWFLVLYTVATVSVSFIAPQFGRVALPCFAGDNLRTKVIYCALNRHYVTPEMAKVAGEIAKVVNVVHPDTTTIALDAGFPFVDGVPLLPHLSHDDGRKLDFAFFYTNRGGEYLRGKTRAPLGYWGFEDGPSDCPDALSLRWDMGWLQPLWPDRPLDRARTATLVQTALRNPSVGKVLLEPHLQTSLGLRHPRLRFQGCAAARHDDHLHIQL